MSAIAVPAGATGAAGPGLKTTVGTLAAGPPGSPVTNDIWVATDVDADGACWQFRYNSAATTYKWEFIGGSPILAGPLGSDNFVSTTALTDLTSGPTATIARAGDYIFHYGAFIQDNADPVARDIRISLVVAGTVVADSTFTVGTGATYGGAAISQMYKKTAVAAASAVKLQRSQDSAHTSNWNHGWFSIQPVRIS